MGRNFRRHVREDFAKGNLGAFAPYTNPPTNVINDYDVDLELAAMKYIHSNKLLEKEGYDENEKEAGYHGVPEMIMDIVNAFVNSYNVYKKWLGKEKIVKHPGMTHEECDRLRFRFWDELGYFRKIEDPTNFVKNFTTLIDIYEVILEGSEESLEMIK